MKFLFKSVPSLEHKEKNEDYMLADPKLQIAAVFDGVGGLALGWKASHLAAESISKSMKKIPQITKHKDFKNLLKKAMIDASNKILSVNPGSATTATVAKILNKKQAVIGHVGDSRAYLFRSRKLLQVTDDDNLVSESGLPKKEIDKINQKLDQIASLHEFELLSSLEKKYFLQRNVITQALGLDLPSPHIYQVILKDGDELILTSDGVHDNLTRSEIENIAKSSPKNLAEALVDKAFERSREVDNIRAKPDDISCMVVELFK